jgi:hypothetical protein
MSVATMQGLLVDELKDLLLIGKTSAIHIVL